MHVKLKTIYYMYDYGKRTHWNSLKSEALEGVFFLGYRDITGYFCKYLKGYGILGSILGILGYIAFRILGIFTILSLGIWDIFQNN